MSNKQIDFSGAKIIEKKYKNPQEAEVYYEEERLRQLSTVLYPVDEYAEGFKETLISLMKFQNPINLKVWHKSTEKIKDGEGKAVITTWDNMCYFSRPFVLAEMIQAVEVLRRATPNEVVLSNKDFDEYRCHFLSLSDDYNKEYDHLLLRFYNEIKYPFIEQIIKHTENVLVQMEDQIMEPIRKRINAELKLMQQIPVGRDIEFIKKKERPM